MYNMEGFKLIIMMVTVVACLQFHGLVDGENVTTGIVTEKGVDIVVGGVKGTWTLQQNPKFYQEWSRDHSGFMRPKLDTLVFNFENGKHNVAQVLYEDYLTCNKAKLIRVWNTTPARFTFPDEFSHSFICTIGDHCQKGLKMEIAAVHGHLVKIN